MLCISSIRDLFQWTRCDRPSVSHFPPSLFATHSGPHYEERKKIKKNSRPRQTALLVRRLTLLHLMLCAAPFSHFSAQEIHVVISKDFTLSQESQTLSQDRLIQNELSFCFWSKNDIVDLNKGMQLKRNNKNLGTLIWNFPEFFFSFREVCTLFLSLRAIQSIHPWSLWVHFNWNLVQCVESVEVIQAHRVTWLLQLIMLLFWERVILVSDI